MVRIRNVDAELKKDKSSIREPRELSRKKGASSRPRITFQLHRNPAATVQIRAKAST